MHKLQIIALRIRSLLDQALASVAEGRDTKLMRDQLASALGYMQYLIDEVEEQLEADELISDDWLHVKHTWDTIIDLVER